MQTLGARRATRLPVASSIIVEQPHRVPVHTTRRINARDPHPEQSRRGIRSGKFPRGSPVSLPPNTLPFSTHRRRPQRIYAARHSPYAFSVAVRVLIADLNTGHSIPDPACLH